MIDLLAIASKAIPVVGKSIKYLKDRNEEKRMLEALESLRRSSQANAGNCLHPEIGSDDDRLYAKMAARGLLVRTPLGYMLPEFHRGF